MNEELINQIVQRILSEPAFQALLNGNAAESQGNMVVKPDVIVLLNYVPEFERVLIELKQCYGADYTLSILPSDQACVAKPELPDGMTWITAQDALSKTTWQKIILPTCSPNTLAKAALGIRDNPISEIIGRGITQVIPTMISSEYLGFTAQTPKAYRELYEGYLQTVKSYGVLVCTSLADKGAVLSTSTPTSTSSVTQARRPHQTNLYEQKTAVCEQNTPLREETRFDKKFLGDKQVYGIPEGSRVLVKQGTVISPLARDTLKQRRIELYVEKEEGRR